MSAHLSSADTAWLRMDRPTNLMVITSVMLFDEPVDIERIRQVYRHRLVGRYPRFRQRVVESRLPLRPPRWEDDSEFDLDHHLHHLALPAPGDTPALQELIGDLMTTPLDRNRPLWQVYVVDGYLGGAAIISRLHHCIADGISLARVMLSLTDGTPDPGVGAEPGETDRNHSHSAPLPPGLGLVAGIARLAGAAARQGAEIVTSPSHGVRLAGAFGRNAGTAARLLLTPPDSASAIKGEPGISRRVAWSSPLPLDTIKQMAHAQDATVNDILLAAVSGALRHYLQDHDSPVPEIQALVPFNLRPLDQPVPRSLGNKFGLVLLPLPVGTSGSYRRLVAVHRRMRDIKQGADGAVSYGLLSVAGLAPEAVERRIVDLFTGKGTAVMTNVPGPTEPVYLAGVPVRTALVWAPTSGHIGMSVSIFSYRGEVTVGLMVDRALVPDPDHIVAGLEEELDVLATLPPIGSIPAAA
ncbi:MAG: wax ester/triacylglycerol synthase family O-acyltransferase [Solirubrobacteraceae bacterium]